MNVSFTENGWKDYLEWQKNDKKTVKRINDLIKIYYGLHLKVSENLSR